MSGSIALQNEGKNTGTVECGKYEAEYACYAKWYMSVYFTD